MLSTQRAPSTLSPSDAVREYARKIYIEPARRRGDDRVRVPVGEVHRALRLKNLVPLVCNALKSRIFLKENGLVLVESEGPPSGLSTTVVYTYRFDSACKGGDQTRHPFWDLRGVAADLFREYGGGEAFLREERSGFFGISQGEGAES